MNIFLREIRSNRKSLIGWSLGMFALVASGMSKFGVYQGSPGTLDKLVEQMPNSLKTIMGVASLDLTKAIGFYGILYLYITLMSTTHAASLGANIIAKEERDRTSEFIFVKPVSRGQVITGKLLASLVNIVIINLVTLLSSVVIVNYYSKNDSFTTVIFILMLGMFFIQLIFLALGMAIASFSKRPKTTPSVATGILLGTFIISIVVDLSAKLEFLKYITPFKYFDAKNVISDNYLEPIFIVFSIIISLLLLIITYRFYDSRDLKV